MMADIGIFPLQQPTAVVGAVSGFFRDEACDLAVATSDGFELYFFPDAEPELLAARKVRGQLTCIHKLSPPAKSGSKRDVLLVITREGTVFILAWDDSLQNFEVAMTFPVHDRPSMYSTDDPEPAEDVDRPLVIDAEVRMLQSSFGSKLLVIYAARQTLLLVKITWGESGKLEAAEVLRPETDGAIFEDGQHALSMCLVEPLPNSVVLLMLVQNQQFHGELWTNSNARSDEVSIKADYKLLVLLENSPLLPEHALNTCASHAKS